jgi:hypothetical protein
MDPKDAAEKKVMRAHKALGNAASIVHDEYHRRGDKMEAAVQRDAPKRTQQRLRDSWYAAGRVMRLIELLGHDIAGWAFLVRAEREALTLARIRRETAELREDLPGVAAAEDHVERALRLLDEVLTDRQPG